MINIPKPSISEVNNYLEEWDKEEQNAIQENALSVLFHETYPKNQNINEILIKASALNYFYSTHILSIYSVAKNIYELNIDKKLENGDETLIDKIANNTINGKNRRFYSFATKYCSHHYPELYPMYDKYVKTALLYFKKQDNFAEFKIKDMLDYTKFKEIIIQFKKNYGLDEFTFKEIDKYLWQLGRKYYKEMNEAITTKKRKSK